MITLIAALYPFPISAMPISADVTATVTSVGLPLAVEFSIGESVSFSYQFDSSTPDSRTTDRPGIGAETRGVYLGTIQSASLLIDDYSLNVVGLANIEGLGNIFAHQGPAGATRVDKYNVELAEYSFVYTRPWTNLVGNTIAGLFPFYLGIELSDHDAQAFSSDALP